MEDNDYVETLCDCSTVYCVACVRNRMRRVDVGVYRTYCDRCASKVILKIRSRSDAVHPHDLDQSLSDEEDEDGPGATTAAEEGESEDVPLLEAR